jgi:hypothetical protein
MLVNDLNYLEAVDGVNDLEGGALLLPSLAAFGASGSVYAEHLRGIKTYSASGPNGTVTGSESMDLSKITGGLTFVGWN